MQALDLITTIRAVLTKTVTLADNSSTSFACDLDGNTLPVNFEPLPIYRDRFTGKTFVRVAEVIPTAASHAAEALAITELNPTHFANDDVRGYFIEAPDFNEREGK